METVMYDVTFNPHSAKRLLHRFSEERPVACVRAVEDSDTFRAYHLHNGLHIRPDYAAIRAAIPHRHRKAFDRAGGWFFPLTLLQPLSGAAVRTNAASLTLTDSRGRLLGTLYATPYIYAPRAERAEA